VTVRFLAAGAPNGVSYAFPDGTEPRPGETVILDGSDEVVGVFTVVERRTIVNLRGPVRVDCRLGDGPEV
jgi:hypothetical protein